MPIITRLYHNILLPFAAQRRMEKMKYGPATFQNVLEGALTFDVPIDTIGWDTSILADCVPSVWTSWNTTLSVIPIPPYTDFRGGFRIVFGAGAPPNAQLSYRMFMDP